MNLQGGFTIFTKKEFGAKIRALRTEKGISQQELGEYLKIGKSAVSMIESGQRAPSIEVADMFALFFEIPMELLMGAPGANLSKANLSHADMREIKACGALFVEADLSFADLRSADLRWADFTDADLHMARLNGANITGAVFTGADVSGTILDVKT